MNKEELIEWIKIECSEDDNFYNELSEELDKIFEKEKIKSYNPKFYKLCKCFESFPLCSF